MILYVFLVWLCAAASILALEYLFLSFPAGHRQHLAALMAQEPEIQDAFSQGLGAYPASIEGLLIFVIFFLALISCYMFALRFQPVARCYRHLQKSYPRWYQMLPAPKREIYLALLLPVIPCLFFCLALAIYQASGWAFLRLGALWLGMTGGLLILPSLRYRRLLIEDRPEQPPEALIQKWVPAFPSKTALVMGQIYLRFLLPLLFVFLLLILPLQLRLLQLSPLQAGLLFTGLIGGILSGWALCRESQLAIENFRNNLLHLTLLLGFSGGLLIFGCGSGNLILLPFMGGFSGFLVASY